MIPNQDNKLSSDSIVAKHMQGKHDQSEHGKGGGGAKVSQPEAAKPVGEIVPDAAHIENVNRLITNAKGRTSAAFPYSEEPRIRSAINSASKRGKFSTLHSLNEKYDGKRYALQEKIYSGKATDWDKENFNAWNDLTAATAAALDAFGETPFYE